jgi:hypothetical protein
MNLYELDKAIRETNYQIYAIMRGKIPETDKKTASNGTNTLSTKPTRKKQDSSCTTKIKHI